MGTSSGSSHQRRWPSPRLLRCAYPPLNASTSCSTREHERENHLEEGSRKILFLLSLSSSLSLFSRVIGVRGPVVFVLGVPFPSLFCTFPEFSFNRGGARAVHARRSLRRLCPPRHFSSQRGGVSVSEGMAMFKLKPVGKTI